MLARGLSGSAGSVVFVRDPSGATFVRERPLVRGGVSQAQRTWRDLIARAGAMWRTLTPEEVAAWWQYADALRAADGPALDVPPANASGLFAGLAAKVWQLDPYAEAPRLPPPTAFTGDGIAVSAAAVPVEGAVRFTASAPNASGVVTEVLLQPLPSATARPKRGKDRIRGAVSFAPGGLWMDVPVRSGTYAASVRFVRASTGQLSALVRLGALVV